MQKQAKLIKSEMPAQLEEFMKYASDGIDAEWPADKESLTLAEFTELWK